MNLDLGPAFTRAQAVVNGFVAAIPGNGDRARQREGWPAKNTDVPASGNVADAIRHTSESKPRGAEGE